MIGTHTVTLKINNRGQMSKSQDEKFTKLVDATSNEGFHFMCNSFQLRCRCDEGYGGETCVPVTPLTSELKSNFSLLTQLESDWLEITGGGLAASQHGCGTIVSGESLYFHKVNSHRFSSSFVMAALCNRAGHYIFACGFFLLSIYLLSFFPRLISAATGWMSTIF